MNEIEEKIGECKRCDLHKERENPVVGEGNLKADVMFIGEAPGYWEDKKGKPFVGKAGELLDEIFDSVDLEREETYITNVLKCRPPDNRNPRKKEIEACTPYLDEQMNIIKPEAICPMGNFAVEYIFKKFGLEPKRISKIHGRVFEIRTLDLKAKVVPLYHPAFALYNPNEKSTLKEDFKVIENLVNKEG